MIILQKERRWLEQGVKVGEHVISLARNFTDITIDGVESGTYMGGSSVEMRNGVGGSGAKPPRDDIVQYSANREAVSNKYAAMREQTQQRSASSEQKDKHIAYEKASLLKEEDSSQSRNTDERTSSFSGSPSKWQSMKVGFLNLKESIGVKNFLPLRQVQETRLPSKTSSSSESLDEIFHRLKHPTKVHTTYNDDEEDTDDM